VAKAFSYLSILMVKTVVYVRIILIFYYLITLTLYSHVVVYVYHGTREAEGNAHERLAQVLNPQNMYELEQL